MRISLHRVVGLAAVLVTAAPQLAHSQQHLLPAAVGPFEAGVFGQVDFLDKAMRTDRTGWGLGGRLGWLFHSRWELEGEASFSRAGASAGRLQTGDVQIDYYIARLDYNMPFKSMWAIASAGIGADALDSHSDLILSPELGIRFPIAQDWHVRADASLMFAPNPTSSTFKFPPTATAENDGAAYLTNYQLRLGIGWLPRVPAETLHVAVATNGASDLHMVCTGAQPATPLTATVTSNRRSDIMQNVTWRSDNSSVASVDAGGRVTAIGGGTATITASSVVDPNSMASARVSVVPTTMVAGPTTTVTEYRVVRVDARDTAIFFATDSPRVAPGRGKVHHTQEELNLLALRDTSRQILDRWLTVLKAEPSVKMADSGWADLRASRAHNDSLSQRRADAAAQYLMSGGIGRDRILSIAGEGETTGFGKGRSAKALQANRRVKLAIQAGTDSVATTRQVAGPMVCRQN